MAYDLLIKNGRIIDGSGLPAYHGDIGVAGGRIVEMGRLDGGRRVIDADGLAVAPGFIDIHTHYDAQVLWDPLLTCSPWHGTTTVIMGNCGFGIAPCAPAARDYLASMFAVVEGMDLVALNAGLDWAWESFPQYLDRVGRESLGLNVGALVGHSALRRYVMGEDGSRREADAGEIEAMTSLLREAMAAGAFGFSSSQTPNHLDAQGVLVASAFASRDELVGLAEVIAEFNVGGIEFISKTAVMGDDVFAQEDQDIMTAMSLASGRPVNWNELSQGSERPTVWRQQLDFMGRAAAAGAQVYAVARCQNMDRMFSLRDNTDFRRWSDTWPNWRDILGRPHAEKVAALASAEGRAALRRDFEANQPPKPLWVDIPKAVFTRGKSGRRADLVNVPLQEIGQRLGKHPVDCLIDLSLEEDLEADFSFRGLRNTDKSAVEAILKSPFSIPGISDAGAHSNRMSGAYYTSFLLGHWVREKGLMTLEEAVRGLTFLPATIYGLRDRGLLREGMAADIVIFDPDTVNYLPAEKTNDLPAGRPRIVNRAVGFDKVIVNGEPLYDGGEHTGALPGGLLRSTAYTNGG